MIDSAVVSKNNEEFTFRKLCRSDGLILGEFFSGLSDATKSKFGPHALTIEYANKLCQFFDDNSVQRFVVADKNMIVGYFILNFNPFRNEAYRYQKVGVVLDPNLDPVFAPCIADKYQNSGIASRSMQKIIETTKRLKLRRIVLMGGTQEPNLLARAFYRKAGFKEYANFYTDHNQLNNVDMMLEI
ncbi:MAG: GNAT superfamily N-acetyltransferase [Flavobacteriales bacterium]|jgi:GNAT superfamily N-acetyltransferase